MIISQTKFSYYHLSKDHIVTLLLLFVSTLLITQYDPQLTAIQGNTLSILVRRTRRPTVTTTVIVIITLIIVPHNLDRLDAPILPKSHRITRGFAFIRLLTVPHLNIKWMSDWFMTK